MYLAHCTRYTNLRFEIYIKLQQQQKSDNKSKRRIYVSFMTKEIASLPSLI